MTTDTMTTSLPFVEFEKIARLKRGVVISEKIDGTNGQIHIRPAEGSSLEMGYDAQIHLDGVPHYIRAGSRNRWVQHAGSDDNFGFGRWVYAHAPELAALGPGAHFGEFWGAGIGRRYGLTEKRFSLFNAGRWLDESGASIAPACCHVVPVLTAGVGLDDMVERALDILRTRGSVAAPGFMRPEGVVVYHTASRSLFKVTLEKDEEPKSMRKSA